MNQVENTRKKGEAAEERAALYLENKGYDILKRNFYFGRSGEIDIVALDGDVIVFIEVKSKTTNSFGNPLDSITFQKQKNIRRAAEGYLYVNKLQNIECRFDAIVVDYENNTEDPEILHLENAF